MASIIKGNLLNAEVDYICHQVNCHGKMNSGVARSIRERWPRVYEVYMEWFNGHYFANQMLGNIQIVQLDEAPYNVINMAAQDGYGYDGQLYTSYDAFWKCLNQIKANVPKGSKIGFPLRIACVRGGANWSVIRTMIEEVLDADYTVIFYEYDGG